MMDKLRVMVYSQPHHWRELRPAAYGDDWDVLLLQRAPPGQVPGVECVYSENFPGWGMMVCSRLSMQSSSREFLNVVKGEEDQGRTLQTAIVRGIKFLNVLTTYPFNDESKAAQQAQVREIVALLDVQSLAVGNFHSSDEQVGLSDATAVSLLRDVTFKSPDPQDHRLTNIDKILLHPKSALKISNIRIWDPDNGAGAATMGHLAISFDVSL